MKQFHFKNQKRTACFIFYLLKKTNITSIWLTEYRSFLLCLLTTRLQIPKPIWHNRQWKMPAMLSFSLVWFELRAKQTDNRDDAFDLSIDRSTIWWTRPIFLSLSSPSREWLQSLRNKPQTHESTVVYIIFKSFPQHIWSGWPGWLAWHSCPEIGKRW